jgi:hypothetical protein
MSRELMVVEYPDFLQRADLDAPEALGQVYRCYNFLLPEEVPAGGQTLIVAAQTGEAEPQTISRNDFYANVLDPVRRKASRKSTRRDGPREFARQGNLLVFVFDAES